MSLPSGTRLGPYQILACIGAGGMGEVYKAADTRLGRTVAMKIIREPTHEILIMHVMHLSTADDYSPGTVGSIVLEPRRHAGQQMLEAARAKLAERGVSVEVDLVESHEPNIADLVVERAIAWHADLILVGTSARQGLSRFVLGSRAAEIVRRSPVPVLLVRNSMQL